MFAVARYVHKGEGPPMLWTCICCTLLHMYLFGAATTVVCDTACRCLVYCQHSLEKVPGTRVFCALSMKIDERRGGGLKPTRGKNPRRLPDTIIFLGLVVAAVVCDTGCATSPTCWKSSGITCRRDVYTHTRTNTHTKGLRTPEGVASDSDACR